MPRVNRYREQLRQRFPWFLGRWLAKLPADGWEGTSRELWDAMTAVARPFDRIPAPNALLAAVGEHAATVTAAGWRVRTRRTARARLVVVDGLPPVRVSPPNAESPASDNDGSADLKRCRILPYVCPGYPMRRTPGRVAGKCVVADAIS